MQKTRKSIHKYIYNYIYINDDNNIIKKITYTNTTTSINTIIIIYIKVMETFINTIYKFF
jgi:hypothetical protein